MARQEWRRKVIPSCLGQAQEAVAQLRSRGILADLRRDGWLVFDLTLDARADPDTVVAEALDRVWPAWRECVTD
jgi:lambda repressor-like predicted transcriptional regulator